MSNIKYKLLPPALLLGFLLGGCGTSQPVEPSETPQVSQRILESAETSLSLMEEQIVVSEAASTPPEQTTVVEHEEASPQLTAQPTTQPTDLPTTETADQKQQLLKTYYDDYTEENTDYAGCLLTLYRRDRAWVEENENISSGDWPLWDYGVNFYPYARDENNLYMLSFPMEPDTDTTDAACAQSYQEALLQTLDTLKDYAAGKGLELNPNLDADYSTFVTRLMKNAASIDDLTDDHDQRQQSIATESEYTKQQATSENTEEAQP